MITYNFVLSSRLEFRKSGIITGSDFYSWRRIQLYEWKPGEHTGDALLKLSMRNSLRMFSVNKLPLREEKRAEAERIVKQFVLVDQGET